MLRNGLKPIHPGEYLAEILEDMNISQVAVAQSIGVSPMRISHVIHGKRPVTAELAPLFAKAFDQTPQYWLNLQTAYDLSLAEKSISSRLSSVLPIAPA